MSMKLYKISPHYSHRKLEPPFYKDLVDVFEDRMWYWMLNPAKKLLLDEHDQIAACGILINYFEAIEIYYSGKDSKNNSKVFFKRGFKRVFSTESYTDIEIKHITEALYDQARCGFAHDGMFRNRIVFSDMNMKGILFTWPKKNNEFYFDNGVESIHINPLRFFELIETSFRNYINVLKSGKNEELKASFKKAVELKWGLDQEYITIGMPYEEFVDNPKYKK
jgi:hypothetical protein